MKLNFAVNNEKNKRMIISNHNDIRPNRLLLKDDPKNNLQNKFNFNINNKKRGRGLLGVTSFETSMATANDINERFVFACTNGDYPTVIRILEALKDFNIDVTDNLGRTALRLAVENEHLEVVQALLGKSDSQKMREALLLAIYLGHTQIAELILRYPKYKVLNEKKFVNEDTDSFWQTPSSDDAQFSPDITPLILAAQFNRTEIVQMLLIGGDRITKPHNYHCKCNECSNKFKFDSLRHAQSRLNAYRGLASESYISLASVDPILTAFELGRELRSLSGKEKYFKNEYFQLAENLSLYAVKLLNNVRGRDELEIVLNKTGKETEEKYERLARLDLALKYHEKPFVAHSNCQQKLVEIWQTGLRKITKMNQLLVILSFFIFILYLPFGCIIYIFIPKIKISQFLCQPCMKFVSHTISYLIFIALIIVSSIQFAQEEGRRELFSNDSKISIFPKNSSKIFFDYSKNENFQIRVNFTDFHIRSGTPSTLDYVINIWIIGFCWHEAKQIYEDGINDYLLAWNNIIDSCMNILYIGSFALKYYSMTMVNINYNLIKTPEFWHKVANLNDSDITTQKSIYQTFYWLNDDRFYWDSFDPINLSEGLFAIANIFSFCRICFLLPANQALGPLQITLGKMIGDIMKFIFIFLIIFAAFMFSLNNLYWYYNSNVRKNVEIVQHIDPNNNSTLTNAEQYFGTIGLTFQAIFWVIFGLGNGNNVMLDPFDNSLTVFFGFMIYGAFHVASIIVLLNMLIAMMAKSYEDILLHSDIEWKFARSQLYMEFIKGGGTLPVPFNIIPTPKSVYYLSLKLFNLIFCCRDMKSKSSKLNNKQNNLEELPTICGRNGKNFTNNINNNHQVNGKTNGFLSNGHTNQTRRVSLSGNDLTYTKVMQRIVKRFLLHKQRESDDVKENNFEELKQDLQMVRFEMLNDIKKSEEDTLKYISLIHNGVAIIGDEILKDVDDTIITGRFKEFKKYETEMRDSIETIDNDVSNVDPLLQSSSLTDNTAGFLYDKNIYNKHSLPNLTSKEDKEKRLGILNSASNDSINSEINLDDEKSISEPNLANTGKTYINLEQVLKSSISELDIIHEEDEIFTTMDHSKM